MLDERQIKAIMHDAEEKVPPHVWSGVSSRLDGASAPSPVWRWPLLGFALAGALVAGVFFIGTSDKISKVAAPNLTAQVVTGDITIQADVTAPTVIPVEIPTSAPVCQASDPAVDAIPSTDFPATGIAADAAPATGIAPAADADAAPATGHDAAAGKDGADTAADPFVIFEKEDSRKAASRRMQLSVGGSVGANGSNGLRPLTMSNGSPASPSSDLIREVSTSSYGIPFTLGVGVRFNLTSRLLIGTGIDYSLLTRTFNGSFTAAGSATGTEGDVRNNLHYVGIPVKLFCNIIDNRVIKFYAYGGCEGEWCVSNRFDFHPAGGGEVIVRHSSVSSPQLSAGVGIGVQFRLADRLGLYLDPGVNYYFHSSQPKCIRTEHPLMFNFNAGLRFDL